MDVLIINDDKPYLEGFSKYLRANYSNFQLTEFGKIRSIKKNIFSKKEMLMQFIRNFFCFIFNLTMLQGGKFNVVLLDGILVTIPYLILAKICPFIKPKRKIIITYFFLHKLGTKPLVQFMLKVIINDKKIILVVNSKNDKEYFLKTVGGRIGKVIYFPYCKDSVLADEDYGKNQDYIFAGGYSNRDYECLFKAAKNIQYNFIIVCSDLNEIPPPPNNVRVLRNLNPKVFNGYLKNSTIVVIPLEANVGSSGQSVALSAMSLEKAIIYSDAECFSEYFIQNISGVSYRLGDAEDLVNKIEFLLANSEKRKELGDEAFKRFKRFFQKSNYYNFIAGLL